MPDPAKKFRFLLIQAFHLPKTSHYLQRPVEGPRETRLMNYDNIKPLLEDVEWDVHPGPLAPYGDWPVETREEFCLVAAGRLPIVREACESGKYNAIVLLGGGEPGFVESREIARRYGIPVTSCAFSQMHVASMLGNKFSVIDLAENHNMYYYNLVVQHRFTERCASIRNVNFPLPRPPYTGEPTPRAESQKALRGERSDMLEAAVSEAVAAIEEVTGRKPELSTSGGTSDARFIASYCPVIEFGLVGQTMHQIDERTPVADLEKLTKIYRGVLDRYFA